MAEHILLGHTGFVGSNLLRAGRYDLALNSKTVDAARGRRCDRLICAAAPGSMAYANRNPDRDGATIDGLIEVLETVRPSELILVSTVGVFSDFGRAADETRTDFETSLAYGTNRRRLEAYVLARGGRVLRLPALYGPGLKKNFLYDLLNPAPSFLNAPRWARVKDALNGSLFRALADVYAEEDDGFIHLDRERFNALSQRSAIETALVEAGLSALSFHASGSTYQFYGVTELQSHIDLAIAHDIDVLHLATAPIATGAVYEAFQGRPYPGAGTNASAALHHEDLRTRHAALFPDGGDGYIRQAKTVMAKVRDFLAQTSR